MAPTRFAKHHDQPRHVSRHLFSTVALVAATVIPCPSTASAQSPQDTLAVQRAALDYLEGFYEGDTAKLVRSIRPEVFKYGFFRSTKDNSIRGEHMPWAEFLSYAKSVKARGRPVPPTAPRNVRVLDMLDQTASVRVDAWWGTDYLLIGRYQDRWMISHVLWQSPPRKP